MMRNTYMRAVMLPLLLTLIALGGGACTNTEPSTGPSVTPRAEVAGASAARQRSRVPYIATLQLSSTFVSTTSGSTPFTVTVTNPTKKDFQDIYLKGELRSQNNPTPVPATAFLAYCPNPNGVVHPGDCAMSNSITGSWGALTPGPGTYTLYVQQQQPDGTMLVLDSKTVDVTLYDGSVR